MDSAPFDLQVPAIEVQPGARYYLLGDPGVKVGESLPGQPGFIVKQIVYAKRPWYLFWKKRIEGFVVEYDPGNRGPRGNDRRCR